jgi:hypothetical protein
MGTMRRAPLAAPMALAWLAWAAGARAQAAGGSDVPDVHPEAEHEPAPREPDEPTLGGEPAGPNELHEPPQSESHAREEGTSKLPFRNSTFLFDQSLSTQTAGLEPSPQLSYVPLYEWWLSFRPRYYFSDQVYVRARFDYYKELTNSSQTTDYREDVLGDTWLDLVYDTKVPSISKGTKVSAGLRLLLPTSKISQDSGIYVQAGMTAGIKQTFTLNGPSARAWNDVHLALSAWYNHPFSRATTPTNESLDYTREDTGGRSFVSDQLRGATLVNHQLVSTIDSGLQITPKLAYTLDAIWISQWHYDTTQNVCVATLTGCAPVTTQAGFGDNYVVSTWLLTELEYQLFDEVSLALGYYNLANEIAPDGNRRSLSPFAHDNVWWSPDARVFFDVTVNLDQMVMWLSGKKTQAPEEQNRNVTTASAVRTRGASTQ